MSDELVASFQPILRLGRIYGFFPFKLICGRLFLPFSNIIYGIIRLVLSVIVLTLRILHSGNYQQLGSFLSQITFKFSSFFACGFPLFVTVFNILNKRNFEIWLKSLLDFDRMVKSCYNIIKVNSH
jgi:hypothetical protein